jgi:hypothetical protein
MKRKDVLKICDTCSLKKKCRNTVNYFRCDDCRKIKLKEYCKKWYKNNCEQVKLKTKQRREKFPNYMKNWRKENIDYVKEYTVDYNKKNRIKINKRDRNRRKNDKNHRTMCLLRGRLRKAVKYEYKTSCSYKLLGCNLEKFNKWIESKFLPGMSWKNRSEWVYDHIIPCNHFIKTLKIINTKKGQEMCFHFTNIQPLWLTDNLIKSDTLPDDFHRRVWKGINIGWVVIPEN